VGALEYTEHGDSGLLFGRGSGLSDLRIDLQTMAVLNPQMPQVCQLRPGALALLEQQGVLVRLRFVGIAPALLVVEVYRGIAGVGLPFPSAGR